jgi:hypothetical protein
MVDDATKFVPFTVSVKLDPPARVDVGLIEIVVGTGLVATVTVNVCAFDVPPPGAGFTTATRAVPVALTSDARMVAVRVVLETKVVDRGEPFQFTTEVDTKFVPFTVIVKSELPAEVEVGEIEVVVGMGFVIVNVSAFDVPPPGAGVTTVIEAVPAVAISDAGTIAVNSLEEMNTVESRTPSQSTVEEEKKFDPSMVNINWGPPAVVEVGLRELRTGAELRTVNVCAFEVPPPGVGFVTVTG